MRLIAFSALLHLSAISNCWADDLPFMQHYYNTRESNALQAECKKSSQGVMDCNFTQFFINKSDKREEFEKRLAGIAQELKNPPKEKECVQYRAMLEAIKTKSLPKSNAGEPSFIQDQEAFTQWLNRMQLEEQRDIENQMSALISYCSNPSEEALRKLITTQHERDGRSCNVWVYNFEQSFNYNIANGRWENVTGPLGVCGVVSINYFEKDESAKLFWRYKTKKTVTNKGAKSDLGLECGSTFDETEYTFDWKSSEWYKRCDYIKFGMF